MQKLKQHHVFLAQNKHMLQLANEADRSKNKKTIGCILKTFLQLKATKDTHMYAYFISSTAFHGCYCPQ